MTALRLLLAACVVPVFALAQGAALDRVADRTWCLDRDAAATSAALTSQLCFHVPDPRLDSPGFDGLLDRVQRAG